MLGRGGSCGVSALAFTDNDTVSRSSALMRWFVHALGACSAFTRVTVWMRAGLPEVTLQPGVSHLFVPSVADPIATGRNDPFAGWESYPLTIRVWSRRTPFGHKKTGAGWRPLYFGPSASQSAQGYLRYIPRPTFLTCFFFTICDKAMLT